MLYRAALEAIAAGCACLARGEIKERSRHLTRAAEILNALALSSDHSSGSEINRDLVEPCAYLPLLLQKANHQQIEPPFIEA